MSSIRSVNSVFQIRVPMMKYEKGGTQRRKEECIVTENEIAAEVVDSSFKIHTHFGPGLFEIVYEVALVHELRKRGLQVERQVPIPIEYETIRFDEGFRADVIVDEQVILELKSIETVTRSHKKQLLTYLRLTEMKLGLLINFGEELIKDGINRVVNGLLE